MDVVFSLMLKTRMWKDCCFKHDIAYWRVVQEERAATDLLLKNVSKKTGNSELAELMYQAVRTGGEPYFPTWYRWGYGLALRKRVSCTISN